MSDGFSDVGFPCNKNINRNQKGIKNGNPHMNGDRPRVYRPHSVLIVANKSRNYK